MRLLASWSTIRRCRWWCALAAGVLCLARAGYLVLSPDLQQMKHYRLSFRDVDAVVACLQYLGSRADVEGDCIRAASARSPTSGTGGSSCTAMCRCCPPPPRAISWKPMPPYAPRIRARVFIVRSDADTKVSFTEGLSLSRSLVGAAPPTVIIVSVFAHMNLAMEWDSISHLLGRTVPDLLRLWRLSYELMRLRR